MDPGHGDGTGFGSRLESRLFGTEEVLGCHRALVRKGTGSETPPDPMEPVPEGNGLGGNRFRRERGLEFT
jgi:hypothetical protein